MPESAVRAQRKQDGEDGGSGQPVDGWRVKGTRGEGSESGVCVCRVVVGWVGGVGGFGVE